MRTEPQIVQAPAQEALGLVGPPRQRERSVPEPSTPPATTSAPAAPPAPPARPRPPQRPQRPEPRYSKQPSGVPDIAESTRGEVTRQVPQRRADVCALGRKYGGWRSGSPESAICDETYGR
ncbi:hypothetical protein [Streptomyces sp.]|uniref:hypothetical protein n=1 Tax=Streptomyces sp. TaxID=1931 RepID=UPI002D5E412D|nr:hypothetical protein [Streptomyces sp.]HZF87516.1 hypothetical protein [Streptomyces sp.]